MNIACLSRSTTWRCLAQEKSLTVLGNSRFVSTWRREEGNEKCCRFISTLRAGGVPARIRAAMDQSPGSQLTPLRRDLYGQLVCLLLKWSHRTVQKREASGTSTLLARRTECGRPLTEFAFGTYFPAGGSSPESSRRRNRQAVLLVVQQEPVHPALCGMRASQALYGW